MSIRVLLVRLLRIGLVVQGACQPAIASSAGAVPRAVAPPAVAPPAVAPYWHTRALVLLLLSVAATGTLLDTRSELAAASATQLAGRYLPLLVVNVSLSAYVLWFGLRRSSYRELFGIGHGAGGALGDVAWAAALALSVIGAENALQTLFGFAESAASHALVPASAAARVCWLGLVPVVGLSEELVYRGYLQRQLSALSGQAWLGVTLQALLFGVAHGEQGGSAVARFALYGLAFGWVTQARRTLWPCVLCHVALDVAAGLSG